jgi:hypothetical protein
LIVLSVSTTAFLFQAGSKAIVSGRVLDSETDEPLGNVNVFLSSTTLGVSTAADGRFVITGVTAGIFDLVASRVGYERSIVIVRMVASDSLYYEIRLHLKVLQTEEVNVTAERPKDWDENLKRFAKAFLGETDYADRCRIMNPEVLNFQYHDDTLVATSDSLLHIENAAFGYRLHLVLASFVWNIARDNGRYLVYSLFEALTPKSADEESEWEKNREESYRGSLKHFLRSLYEGNSEHELFRIYSGSVKRLSSVQGHLVSPDELMVDTEAGTPFKTLEFGGCLRVEYGRRTIEEESENDNNYQRRYRPPVQWAEHRGVASLIELKSPYALIDSMGNLLNPLSVEVSGAWAKQRIAELLPMY